MKDIPIALALAAALSASAAQAQTFKTLLMFTGTGGAASGVQPPAGDLAIGGNIIYGMTAHGGVNGYGNVFSLGMDGTNYQNLVSFSGTGGATSAWWPNGGVTLVGTTLYGVTQLGGTNGFGNVFSVGTDGMNYQNLLSFSGSGASASGNQPEGNLAVSGTALFGMTRYNSNGGFGGIFTIGLDGTNFHNLLAFTGTGGAASGWQPLGSLTIGGTTLYGMTYTGGTRGVGNVFSAGINGTYQNLVSFNRTSGTPNGQGPLGALTLDGTTLFGMTSGGGSGHGNIFSVSTGGTNYNNLLSFTGTSGAASGASAVGSLTLSGTTLFGMTESGGTSGYGNIFSVGIDGSGYQNLYSFSGGADGAYPLGGLTLSGGTLFGTTSSGGSAPVYDGNGTIFALALPTPTPEPGTLAIVGSGAAAMGAYRWRRRKAGGFKKG